jgi:transcriptional regulator with XRE-family HTH domain
MRLNADLLRRRRRELGISERDLAAAAGASKIFIRHLESGGGDDQVTMEVLRRIARALAVSVNELLEATDVEIERDDVAVAGALLTEIGEPTPPVALAGSLGWDLERTEAALVGLAAAAPQLGLALQRLHGLVAMRRSATDLAPEQLRRAHTSATARRGLDANAARMLYLVLTDQLGDKRRLNIREQQALVQLRKGGLLVESAPESHLRRQALNAAGDLVFSLRPR